MEATQSHLSAGEIMIMRNWLRYPRGIQSQKRLVSLKDDIIKAFKGGSRIKVNLSTSSSSFTSYSCSEEEKYACFDEHVSDQNSSIFTKYPSFLNDKGLVEFLCNSSKAHCRWINQVKSGNFAELQS